MFKKLLAGVALTLMVATSFAGQTTLDTSGLSDAQVAELKAIAARKVAETAANAGAAAAGTSPEKITAGVTLAATWGQQAASAAEGFARALGIAAKELNVTINDFLGSPAGKLTAFLIVWKVAGASILQFGYGLLVVTVGLTLARVLYVRLFTKEYKEVQYERFFGAFKGTKLVRVPKGFRDLENDGEWLAFWVMVVITLVTMFLGGIFV